MSTRQKDSFKWGGDDGTDSAFPMGGPPQFKSRGQGRMFMPVESELLYPNEIPWTISSQYSTTSSSSLCSYSPRVSRTFRHESLNPRPHDSQQLISLPSRSHSQSGFGKPLNLVPNPLAFRNLSLCHRGQSHTTLSTSSTPAGRFSNLITQSSLQLTNRREPCHTSRTRPQSPNITSSLLAHVEKNVLDIPKRISSDPTSSKSKHKKLRQTSPSPPILSLLVKTSGTGGTSNLKKKAPPPPRIKLDWQPLRKTTVTLSPPVESLSLAFDLRRSSTFLPIPSEILQQQLILSPTPVKDDQTQNLLFTLPSTPNETILNFLATEESKSEDEYCTIPEDVK